MLILDTDHLVEYQKGTSAESQRLNERLAQQSQPFGTTIISVEEIMRGWMAAIRRVREPSDQVKLHYRQNQGVQRSGGGAPLGEANVKSR